MKHFLLWILIAIPTITIAQNAEFPSYPTNAQLHLLNGEMQSVIVNCEPNQNHQKPEIECVFNQTSVSPKTDRDTIDAEIQKGLEETDLSFLEITNGLCKDMKNVDVKAEMKPDELELFNKMNELCNLSSNEIAKDTLISVLTYIKNREADTCVITSGHKWYEKFVYKSSNKSDGYWVSDPDPSGECGIINISTLKPGHEFVLLWNYESQRIVTNKTGEYLPGLKCSSFEDRKVEFTWRSQTHSLDCKRVEFSQ